MRSSFRSLATLAGLGLLLAAPATAEPEVALAATGPARIVGAFSASDLDGWEVERFAGETAYDFQTLAGRTLLRARAEGTASGLVRNLDIDLAETPIVEFSWILGEGRAGLDRHAKAGDDYPLRVYFVVKRGLFDLDTIALQYVWSLGAAAGESWTNPFADGVRHLALDSGREMAGRLVTHRRNLREDFRALFGEDIAHIDAVAIMTDADNAGGVSAGWYGDILFAAE